MAKAKKKTKQGAGAKAKGGRPSKYQSGFPGIVGASAESHAPMRDQDVAELLGVSETTVKSWYHQYPEFLASVKKAKAISDDKVELSLFERATGYSVPDVHIGAQGVKMPLIKHYPPDVVACIFWLKNRRPAEWRDRQEVDTQMALNVRIISYADAEVEGFDDDGRPLKRDR